MLLRYPPTARTPRAPRIFASALLLVALGCGDGAVDDTPPDDCAVYAWQPDTGDFSSFPTAEMMTEDASTDTGLRLDISIARFAAIEDLGPLAPRISQDMSTLSGFGLQADGWMTFATPPDDTGAARGTFVQGAGGIARGDGQVRTSDGIGILILPTDRGDLPPTTTQLWPVDVRHVGGGQDAAYIWPMRPLPEGARVAYFATQSLSSVTTTSCVAPSAGMRALLRNPDADRAEAIAALTELEVIDDALDLVALHVVTTQIATRESYRLAEGIADHVDTTFGAFSCSTQSNFRVCDTVIPVQDYRDSNGVVQAAFEADGAPIPQQTWDVPVRIWLPDDGGAGAPYPTLILGHGLSGDRSQANGYVQRLTDEGWAGVAIDALKHGDHPSNEDGGDAGELGALDFFAVDLENVEIEALRLRDHWRQSTYDKLQLLKAILQGELDGDTATADVDLGRIGYMGISLGGIMSNEFAALTDEIDVVVNYEGGGQYSSIVNDPSPISPRSLRCCCFGSRKSSARRASRRCRPCSTEGTHRSTARTCSATSSPTRGRGRRTTSSPSRSTIRP